MFIDLKTLYERDDKIADTTGLDLKGRERSKENYVVVLYRVSERGTINSFLMWDS